MARKKAIPDSFGRVHPRYMTPSDSTIWMGAVSIAVFAFLELTSQNLIADAFTSLSMTIAFYYGMTGIACTWFYRHHLLHSAKNFLFLAVLPLFGSGILAYVFYKATKDYSAKDGGYAKPFLGVGSPVVITACMIILGLVLMFAQWRSNPEFFRRRPVPVDPALGSRITDKDFS
jgi:amino acid transporter